MFSTNNQEPQTKKLAPPWDEKFDEPTYISGYWEGLPVIARDKPQLLSAILHNDLQPIMETCPGSQEQDNKQG